MKRFELSKHMLVLLLTIIVCISCGAGEDGIEGTGFDVKGTVAVGAAVVNSKVIFRDKNGNRRTTTTDTQGKYQIDVSDMVAPYFIKVNVNSNKSLYSIAYQAGVANVHPISDIIIRNWFARENRNIDDEFNSDEILNNTPTSTDIDNISNSFQDIFSTALNDFSVDQNFDFLSTEFNADQTGFDALLDHIVISIEVNQFSVVVIAPQSNIEATLIADIELSKDFTQPDISAPSIPDGLIALPNNTQSVVLVWNASSDDTGVAGYNVYRDDVLLSSSTYPVFSDTNVNTSTEYCYSVEAYDGTANSSAKTSAVCITLDNQPDNSAPSPVRDLLISAGSSTNISLFWTASNDDDVMGYRIYRKNNADYALVSTVTSRSKLDSDLSPATEYCYKIKSFDAAGNESDFSEEICATTGQANNTNNSGKPQSIQLSALNYVVQESDGTASIIVTRTGDTTQATTVNYQLTGGTAIEDRDFVADTGTLQWAANDVTDKVIFVQIKPDLNNEADETINVSLTSSASNATLGNPSTAILSIRDSLCENIISADITTDTTISAPCNIVTDNIDVIGATLTINPGVTLIFQSDTGINIAEDGAMYAAGSEAKPILFTSENPTPGYWRGITYSYSNDIQNVLRHATVEFGSDANIELRAVGSSPARLLVENCTLSDSSGYGFSFGSASTVNDFSNNTIIRNAKGAGNLAINLLGQLDANSQYSGNLIEAIQTYGNVTSNQSWPAFNVPIFADTVFVEADLKLAAGTTMIFDDGAYMGIRENGSLNAIGTPEAMITFTNNSQTPGAWQGIDFAFSNDAKNELDYVIVEYGGSGEGANISTTAAASSPVRLKLSNSILRYSTYYGFDFESAVIIDKFENNTITGNEFAVGSMDVDLVEKLDKASNYSGNNADHIYLTDFIMTKNQTMKKLNADYRLGDLRVEANLTIEPGVNLIFDQSSLLDIYSTGSLIAVGSAEEKIKFTSTDEFAGSWQGIEFTFSSSNNNQIIHSKIEYAGLNNGAAIYLYGNNSLFSRATIQNTKISFSDNYAILLDQDAQINTDVETSNEFVDNVENIVFRNN